MNPYATFDDVVDAALDELAAGKPIDGVLAAHQSHAAVLRPLLETALDLGIEHPPAAPAATRLAHNYVILQAAVERAQMAAAEAAAAEERRRHADMRPWWQRRLASLSMPAGALVLVAVGLSGAAAATVVTTPDLPARIAEVMMGSDGGGEPRANAGQPPAVPGAPSAAPTDVPGAVNAPVAVDTSGVVSGVSGDSFLLTVGEDEWRVQFDSRTEITGEIADGAIAGVLGFATAEKVIHAGAITVTAPAPVPAVVQEDTATPTATNTRDDPPNPRPSSTPTPTPQPEYTPGPPPRTPKPGKTPPGNQGGAGEDELPDSGDAGGA